MKNGTDIASVTDKDTGAVVVSVTNERGSVQIREVRYADGLGEERIAPVPENIARIVARNDAPLRKAVKAALSGD